MERRSIIDIRFPINLRANILWGEGREQEVLVRNVSRRGVAFELDNGVPAGEPLTIRIGALAARPFKVMWRHGRRAGGEFEVPLGAEELASIGPQAETISEVDDDALAGTLRRLRRSMDLTQAEFAKAIGTTRETVWSWESGKTRPAVDKIFRAFAFFDTLQSDDNKPFVPEENASSSEAPAEEIRDGIHQLQARIGAVLGIDPEAIIIEIKIDTSRLP